MFIENIIAEKKRLMSKGVAPETMLIKLRRPVAEWLTLEKLVNWASDRPLLGVKAEVDENLKADFTITLVKK